MQNFLKELISFTNLRHIIFGRHKLNLCCTLFWTSPNFLSEFRPIHRIIYTFTTSLKTIYNLLICAKSVNLFMFSCVVSILFTPSPCCYQHYLNVGSVVASQGRQNKVRNLKKILPAQAVRPKIITTVAAPASARIPQPTCVCICYKVICSVHYKMIHSVHYRSSNQ